MNRSSNNTSIATTGYCVVYYKSFKMISNNARLAVVLPFNFSEFDQEDWDAKDVAAFQTFKWIKLDLHIHGDEAEYLLRHPQISKDSIDEFYFSAQDSAPDPESKEWVYNSAISSAEIAGQNLQRVVAFTFFQA